MGIILIVFLVLSLTSLLSLKVPEKSSSRFWLVAWTWRNIGKPYRNYLLQKVTTAKVIYRYLEVMGLINASTLIFNMFRVKVGDWVVELSADPVDKIVLVIDILLTVVAVAYLLLQYFKTNNEDVAGTTAKDILYAFANKHDEIKELLPLYQDSIEKLHLKEAYKHLVTIRKIVCKRGATDYELLATIDFLMGKCSRFIKENNEKDEFSRAFDEMEKANAFLVDIVEEYIYININRNKKTEVLDLCKRVLDRVPDNALAYAAKVVLAEDVEKTYKEVPESVLSKIDFQFVLMNYILHHPEQEWLCIDDVRLDIPEDLTYDNLRQWSSCISISSTRLLREGHFFYDGRKITPILNRVYNIITKYKELSKGTDIENIYPDVEFIALYCEFHLSDDQGKRTRIIASMKDCKPSRENTNSYTLMLLEMLFINKNFEEAAHLLEEHKGCNDEMIALVWFILATRTIDKQFVIKAFEHLKCINILLPDMHCQSVLTCAIIYGKDLKQYEHLKVFQNSITQQVYEYAISYFSTSTFDVETIKCLAEKAPKEARFILAQILGRENCTDEALKIIEPLTANGVYSVEMGVYLNIIRGHEKYNDIYFDALKKLRKNGVSHVDAFLEDEYFLAVSCNDLNDAGEVICLLFDKYPDNNSVLCNYLYYLNLTQQHDKFSQYVDRIINLVEDDNKLNSNFFNLLILQGFYNESLEFLYRTISRTKSQELKDLWFQYMHTPHISPIINEEKKVVENGDFVVYEENGQEKSEDVFNNSNTEKLIGHNVGDEVALDRFGVISKAKIRKIFNKYQSLTRQIYRSLQQGQSKSIRMLSLDDLKGGDGNILANLMMLSGGYDHKRQIDEWEKQYARGEKMLIESFGGHNAYEDCIDRLFGNKRIYCLPCQNYKNCPITDYECVLDITSVALLSMLSKLFGVTFDKKFVIPNGLQIYLQQCLQREKVNMPTLISSEVIERLKLNKEKQKSYHLGLLEYILEWIDKNCIIEVATKRLNLNFKESDYSFWGIQSESMLLTIDKKRCMISEDWGLMSKFENFRILNTEAYLYLLNVKDKADISKFLADLHFVGVNVDSDYMVDQYSKKNRGLPNTFDECLESLRINMYKIKDGLNLANKILNLTIKLPADTLAVTNIFSKILEDKSTEFRVDLIEQLKNQKGLHPDFMRYLMDTVKIDKLLLV